MTARCRLSGRTWCRSISALAGKNRQLRWRTDMSTSSTRFFMIPKNHFGVSLFSPHLCVVFLLLILYPSRSSSRSSSSARSSSLSTTTFVTPSLSNTISHTHLCHTPSVTDIFVNHHLSHTISHTHLCHTPSVTHIFVNHIQSPSVTHTHLCQPPSLSHTPSVTHIFVNHHLCHTPHLSHTSLSTTIFVTPSLTHIFVTHQAWHLVTSISVSCGRRHTWWHPPWFCVAGVALRALGWLWWRAWTGSRHFAWQAWNLATSAFVSRGRPGTWWHPPSFCVAGVVLRALGWLWWRAWTGLVAGDAAALCVAGVALGDVRLCFTWQTWHLVTSTFVLRGKRGT